MAIIERLKSYIPALAVIGAAPGMAQLAMHARFWVDGRVADALGDGLNYWAGAFLALDGRYSILFDPDRYSIWFAGRFGLPDHVWSYPPSYLLMVLGLGHLSPLAGVLLFSLVSGLALWIALNFVPLSRAARLAVWASPAALTSVGGGQNGALLGSFIIGGLFVAETSPFLGGAIMGLATVKPQLGLLVPFYWLAAGRWRAAFGAAVAAGALILLSLLLFPLSLWRDFLADVLPYMAYLGEALTGKTSDTPRAMIASSLSMARQLGAGAEGAIIVQIFSSSLAVIGAIWLGRCQALPVRARLGGLLILGPLSVPYIWCYDMIPASCGAVLLLVELKPLSLFPSLFLGLAWIAPGVALYEAMLGRRSFMPLWLAAGLCFWLAAWLKQQTFHNKRFQPPSLHGKGAP